MFAPARTVLAKKKAQFLTLTKNMDVAASSWSSVYITGARKDDKKTRSSYHQKTSWDYEAEMLFHLLQKYLHQSQSTTPEAESKKTEKSSIECITVSSSHWLIDFFQSFFPVSFLKVSIHSSAVWFQSIKESIVASTLHLILLFWLY